MYLALTYDHRLLDGREAVTFLVKVCIPRHPLETITNPITGQGVHRGPPTHASWLGSVSVSSRAFYYLRSRAWSGLVLFVNYYVPRYKCNVKDRSCSGLLGTNGTVLVSCILFSVRNRLF